MSQPQISSTGMDVPVLIIGAGPSGATTALLLARQGIKSLVISKHQSTANTPRAHIFNQRAMEVLRDAGLEKTLDSLASPAHHMQHTSWLNKLSGEEYGRIYAWGNDPSQKGEYEMASPCSMSDLPQSILEPILVNEATEAGATFRFYTEFVSLTQSPRGVHTTLRDRKDDHVYEIHSRFLIGADGARSTVLDAVGIPVIGTQLNTAFNVHIRADLFRYIAHRPGVLNWILNTEAPEWSAVGNFRMVKPWNEFVVSMHRAVKAEKPFRPSEEAIRRRLYQMIGDDTVDIEILSSFEWTINDQVAETWSKGNVYCIGDAVHRHPPINGLGSNTCISDAFNLAWKMAYVLKGWAGVDLLDTLTIERKPVGDAVVKRANEGMVAHQRLWALLGLDAEARQKSTALLEQATPEGAEARRNLWQALDATKDEVQALGIQMNQEYLCSPTVVVEEDDVAPDFERLNALRHLKVSTFPGYHVPHVWIAKDSLSSKISTLDLCGKGDFTLFTGIGGQAWITAAERISDAGRVQVHGYTVGFRCDYTDCYQDWARVRGVGETGVVLVRPDHFVAWRCQEVVDDPGARLSSVLTQILRRDC